MDEYIKREAAIEKIIGEPPDAHYPSWYAEKIEAIPASDVATVRHGRWISKNPHGYEWTFVCSNCGYVDGYPFNDRHNYCPNCGADMREKEE